MGNNNDEERKPERKTATSKVEYICELDGRKFESYKDLIAHVRFNYRMPVYSYFALITERLQRERERVAELEEKLNELKK